MIDGHACVACGHTNPVAPTTSTDDWLLAAGLDSPSAQGESGSKSSNRSKKANKSSVTGESTSGSLDETKVLIGAGAVLAVVFVIAALFLMSGDSDAEEVAASPNGSEETDAPEALPLVDEISGPITADYCANPVPVADAPQPSETSSNAVLSAVGNDFDGWRTNEDSIVDTFLNAWSEDGVDVENPAYAACVRAEPTGASRVCRGYTNGVTHSMFNRSFAFELIEVATAEVVQSGTVAGDDLRCPPFAVSGQATNQDPDNFGISMLMVDAVLPTRYTDVHLSRELNFLNESWCQSPSAIPEAVGTATSTGVFPVGFSPGLHDDIHQVSFEPGTVTHVACSTLSLSGETFVCEYEGARPLTVDLGTYTVDVVDLATGEVIGSETVDGSVCPNFVIQDADWTGRQTVRPPTSLVDIVNTTLGTTAAEDAQAEIDEASAEDEAQ